MGKPTYFVICTPSGELTRGVETSSYPEEKKSIEIPIVAVSEVGRAQTRLTSVFLGL